MLRMPFGTLTTEGMENRVIFRANGKCRMGALHLSGCAHSCRGTHVGDPTGTDSSLGEEAVSSPPPLPGSHLPSPQLLPDGAHSFSV